MESIRAFLGIQLPTRANEQLAALIHLLQANLAHTNIRWSAPQNLHITLQFLKSINKEDISSLVFHVQQQLQEVTPFTIDLGEIELFPSLHKPHVITLQVKANESLTGLAGRVGKAILQTGYEIEQRPYRAHLTLGRLRHKEKWPLPLGPQKICDVGSIPIEEICLWESRPSPHGSCYILLQKLALKVN